MIGIANGIVREATYGKRLSTRAAHQVSGMTAVSGFTTYFWVLERRWPIATAREAAIIGATWAGLTVAFEFGFGRAVAKQSWEQLLADNNVAEGHTWPLVLAWIALGPAVVRALHREAPAGGARLAMRLADPTRESPARTNTR